MTWTRTISLIEEGFHVTLQQLCTGMKSAPCCFQQNRYCYRPLPTVILFFKFTPISPISKPKDRYQWWSFSNTYDDWQGNFIKLRHDLVSFSLSAGAGSEVVKPNSQQLGQALEQIMHLSPFFKSASGWLQSCYAHFTILFELSLPYKMCGRPPHQKSVSQAGELNDTGLCFIACLR